ncbi:MAG: hypothetical protein KDA52_12870 [Planctomycetaceae bacterium]|nr:hypothetical protein [Planctomycetaceae bacterium]
MNFSKLFFYCIWAACECCSMASCAEAPQSNQGHFSLDQQLVIAAFQLDVDAVDKLLQTGANPNKPFDCVAPDLFEDKRMLTWPNASSSQWTALMAVANSFHEPQPLHRTANNPEALEIAKQQLTRIDPLVIKKRN